MAKRRGRVGEPLLAFGETKTMAEWSRDPRCVVSYQNLTNRTKKGQTLEKAMSRPVHTAHRDLYTAFGRTMTLRMWARDTTCVVKLSTLRSRINNGFLIEEALTSLPNKSNTFEAFGEFKTVADWARDSRCVVSYQVLSVRLTRGIPLEVAISAFTHQAPRKQIGKKLYFAFGIEQTIEEWAKDPRWSRSVSNLRIRLAKGQTVEQALSGKKTMDTLHTAFGEEKTLRQWLLDDRCLVHISTVVYRLKGGQSFERAISKLPRQPKPIGSREGRKFEAFGHNFTISEWAENPICVVNKRDLHNRLNSGMEIVRALTLRRGTRTVACAAFGEVKGIKEWTHDPRAKVNYFQLRTRLKKGWDFETALTTEFVNQRWRK